MKIIVNVSLAVLLATLCLRVQARRSKCAESRDLEMDVCASRMGFIGDHRFRVPQNASATEAFCTQLKDSIGCVQGYSRDCLSGHTKQILSGLLRRGKQQHQSICASDSSRAQFMNKMSCLAGNKIEKFHSCVDGSIGRFEFIAGEIAPENKLPHLCCSYQIFFADTNETMNKLCGANSDATRYIQSLVAGTTGELLQLVCEGHRSMADCQRSPKTKANVKRLEEITKAAKSGKLRPRSKSLIPPLLEILDTSGQD